jgi:hypothetical protein
MKGCWLNLLLEICNKSYNIVARMRGDYYKTGIGLTTGFIGSHTVTVYTLHNSLLQLQFFSEDCCSARILTRNWNCNSLLSCQLTQLLTVKVTLRPTTSRSVSPGFKGHEGLTTWYLFLLTFTSIVLSITGGPLWREVGPLICHSHCPSIVSKYIQIYM